MELQIQDLVSSIRKDGIDAANAEAEAIIAEAKKKADAIIADAKSEAKKYSGSFRKRNRYSKRKCCHQRGSGKTRCHARI